MPRKIVTVIPTLTVVLLAVAVLANSAVVVVGIIVVVVVDDVIDCSILWFLTKSSQLPLPLLLLY